MLGAFVPIPDDDQPVPHRSGLIRIRPQSYDRAVPIRIIFNGNRSHAIPAGLTFLETPGHGLKWEKRSPQRWEPNPPRSLAIYDRVCHLISDGFCSITVQTGFERVSRH